MNILITGGLGFIGTNLTKLLLTKSEVKRIIIIDNQSKTKNDYLKSICDYKYFDNHKNYYTSRKRVSVIKADTKNYKFSNQITKNIDVVIHLAAESGVDLNIANPKKSFDTNILGTFNYLESSRDNGVKNFIFSSSGSVFGDATPPMSEETLKKPISTYGSSKLTIESFCETYSRIFKLKTTVLRFSNAYGPFSLHKKSIIANFANNILKNKPIIIYGDGKHTRDYIHVSDIVDAIFRSCFQNNLYSNYNIATGEETSIIKLIELIRSSFKKYGINNIKVKYAKERLGDMKYNSMDPTKYKKTFQVKKLLKLQEGLKQTIDWYICNKNV